MILRLVAESLPSWVIDRYLELAARHGQLDQLLADLLLAAETIESAAQAPSRSRLLDLVRPRVVAPSRTDLPSVRDALRQHPSLVYELLAPPIADGRTNEVAAIVTWLAAGDALSGALRPLQAIQPDGDVADGALGKAELRAVWQLDPNYLRTVLDLACHAGWADLVLPAVWSWLPSLGERLSFDERRGWLATLQRLPPPTVGRGTVLVQLDLLALLLDGRTLRPLDQTLQSDEAADYLEKLPDAINSRQLNQWRPQLLERLASHVRGLAWTQPPTLARHVLHLLRIVNDALTTHSGSALPSNPAAALQIVVDGIVADASILELPAYQGEWRAIIEQSPRHSQQILRAALKRSIEGEALPEALGVACARELVQITDLEIAVDNLVAILRDSAVPWRGEDVERFLDTLRRELRRGGMSPQRVDWVDSVLVDRVLAASLSVTLADSYRHYLARAIPMELARLVSLIGKARVDIPTEALPGLRNAARELDQLAKRRGQGSRFRRSKA